MSMSHRIILIVHNVRSCHNVGSLLRTAEGLGVETVYLTGYTPYPAAESDDRLPHIAAKVHKQIQKTALGAEQTIEWQQTTDILEVVNKLIQDGFVIAGLEQTPKAVNIIEWPVPSKTALVVGRETEGLEQEVLQACNAVVEIPMFGRKESFNVVQAAAMALFHCKFAK